MEEDFYHTLNDITVTTTNNGGEQCITTSYRGHGSNDPWYQLRNLGWKEDSTCLVYGLEGNYNEHIKQNKFTIDSLQSKDRAIANLLMNVKDGGKKKMLYYMMIMVIICSTRHY